MACRLDGAKQCRSFCLDLNVLIINTLRPRQNDRHFSGNFWNAHLKHSFQTCCLQPVLTSNQLPSTNYRLSPPVLYPCPVPQTAVAWRPWFTLLLSYLVSLRSRKMSKSRWLPRIFLITLRTVCSMSRSKVRLSLQWRHNERDGVSNHQP